VSELQLLQIAPRATDSRPASLIIVWRFTGDRVFSHVAEQRAQKLVAVQFFLLAPYVAFRSAR
jgi:hypothetical protein